MQTITTSAAAKSLEVHPLNLLLRLQAFGGALDQCWPTVEQGYVDTIKHMDSVTTFPKERSTKKLEPPPLSPPSNPATQISASAQKVIEKLWRKGHWGKKEVSWDTLHNHYCQGITDLKEAVEELVDKGYLSTVSDGHAYSLIQARRAEIEVIAARSISTPSPR